MQHLGKEGVVTGRIIEKANIRNISAGLCDPFYITRKYSLSLSSFGKGFLVVKLFDLAGNITCHVFVPIIVMFILL